jgi:hypothetical protein
VFSQVRRGSSVGREHAENSAVAIEGSVGLRANPDLWVRETSGGAGGVWGTAEGRDGLVTDYKGVDGLWPLDTDVYQTSGTRTLARTPTRSSASRSDRVVS